MRPSVATRLAPVLFLVSVASSTAFAIFSDFGNVGAGLIHDGGYGVCVGPTGQVIGIGTGAANQGTGKDLWLFGEFGQLAFQEPSSTGIAIGRIAPSTALTGGAWEDCGYNIRSVYQPPGVFDGYVMVGHTRSEGAGQAEVWVIRAGKTVSEQWRRHYGGSSDDFGFDIRQTRDGGYIVVGATESFGEGGYDVFLLKIGPDGAEHWRNHFGGHDDDVGYGVQQTRDGGYIITGFKEARGGSDKQVWLIKTDGRGEIQWEKDFGGDKDDCGRSVAETRDGGCIVAGWTESFGATSRDAYLIRIKAGSQGEALWERTVGGRNDDCAQSILVTRPPTPEQYVFTGWTRSYEEHTKGRGAIWLVGVQSDGSGAAWNRLFYGDTDYFGYGVEHMEHIGGGYAVAGVCNLCVWYSPGLENLRGGWGNLEGGWLVSESRGSDGVLIVVPPESLAGQLCRARYKPYDSQRGDEGRPWGPIPCAESGEVTLRNAQTVGEIEGSFTPSTATGRNYPDNTGENSSPLDVLARALSNQWIATHRIYAVGTEPYDAVFLAEKTLNLSLAKGGFKRESRYEPPKRTIDRIEPLVEQQVADNIRGMLEAKGLKLNEETNQRLDCAIEELSKRCCEYGAPVPGIALVRVSLDESSGQMKEAVVQISRGKGVEERVVKVGDLIDDFMITGRDEKTNTLLLRKTEEGAVFRIWPGDMWKNLGAPPPVKVAQEEPEPLFAQAEEKKPGQPPEATARVALDDQDAASHTKSEWSERLKRLWQELRAMFQE